MASQLETTGTLERRLTLSVNPADISSKVQERLRSMAKTTRMPGFRPGKVPVRLIEQSYGPQVHSEVLGEAISRAFSDAVQAENLRVAGQPEIAPKDESQGPDATEFVATFEVYPDVKLGDPATLEVDRYNASVDDKALEATIDVLRKQRTRWNAVDRAGEKGDRATIDFVGKLDGEAFPGGSAEGFPMVLGEGRMLPDFEAGVLGKNAGETVTFDVKFPDDYNAEHLAGKTAQFEVKIQKIEAPELPEVDADFARQMGQEDGDVEKFRADVRTNLEREVRQRVQSRTKSSVMDKIVGLEIGADDYVTKPYSYRELLARLKAVLRRSRAVSLEPEQVLVAGRVRMDVERHEVRVDGEPVSMPLREFELLELFLRHPGRVLTRRQIIERLWGPDYEGDTKTLDVHVKRLRGRVEMDASKPVLITTVRGLGYRLDSGSER